jgi:pyridoxamine 5'-phosphate oxidase
MSEPQHADLIVRNIDWLITVDPGRRVIRDAALAVKDGLFAAVGKSVDIDRDWYAQTIVDASNTVATPGLIDNHLHSSFHLARGLADEANAQSFLFEHMYPYEVATDVDDVYVAAMLAATEQLRHGVTCFIEPGNYEPDATVRAVMTAGMRMVLAVSCFDRNKSVTGLMPDRMIETREQCVEKTQALFERYPGEYAGRLSVSASFRGMNNSSDELILALKEIATKHAAILQTHACYSYFTRDSSIAQFGKPEIERLEALGVLDEKMLLLHSGWFEPQEIEILARRKPTLVCCPSSSLHNGYGNLAVGMHPELMALGVNVSLGTDHASSGSVDLVQEMRYCAAATRRFALTRASCRPSTQSRWRQSTARAVQALRIKSARSRSASRDFILFERPTRMQPLYNPVSNLVYSATGNSVKHVFVGGTQVVNAGPLFIDEEGCCRSALSGAARRGAPRHEEDDQTTLARGVSMPTQPESAAVAPRVPLNEAQVSTDPLQQFDAWMGEAIAAGLPLPNAMTLATITPDGHPAARLVLLKGVEQGGFVFYTNYESSKAHELAQRKAALVFYWGPLDRQVRIEGSVERVSAADSDTYFATRHLGSRHSAWASPQSQVVPNRAWLEERAQVFARQYGQDVPRPPHWGGYRVLPSRIEFWQGRDNRLHDRLNYARKTMERGCRRLAP